MKLRDRKRLLTSFIVGMTALGCQAPAHAQEASSDDSSSTEADGSLSEVTITGSRLRVTGMTAPTPVTVVSASQLEQIAPGNIAQAIRQLPQFRGNIDATQSNGIGTDAG